MLNNIAVSVVMPVYNTDNKLLIRAIESVITQSLREFEFIIVDDGSTNGINEICNQYADMDERIVTIHTNNEGLCAARNTALGIAKGEYIAFLDHDDEFKPDLLMDNYSLAKRYNADVVKFGYEVISFDSEPKFPFSRVPTDVDVIVTTNIYERYSFFKRCGILTCVWDGIYERNFLMKNNIYFDTYFKIGQEDISFNNKVCSHKPILLFNNKKYYNHYRYTKSTSRGMDKFRSKMLIHHELYVFTQEFNLVKKVATGGVHDLLIDIAINNVLAILASIFRCDCRLSTYEKKIVLNKIRELEIWDEIKPRLKMKDFNHNLCIWLLYYRMYDILLFIVTVYVVILRIKYKVSSLW